MAARAKNRKTFKRLLLLNQSIDFEIILQECSLGDPLPELLKLFHSVEQDGRQTPELKLEKPLNDFFSWTIRWILK